VQCVLTVQRWTATSCHRGDRFLQAGAQDFDPVSTLPAIDIEGSDVAVMYGPASPFQQTTGAGIERWMGAQVIRAGEEASQASHGLGQANRSGKQHRQMRSNLSIEEAARSLQTKLS
jgi:hypothetical protein